MSDAILDRNVVAARVTPKPMSPLTPRARARLAGVFEALEGLPAAFGQTIVLGMLLVQGNAAATANNILTHETLYRLGFAIPLLAVGFHITWVVLFYQLFKPVHRTINLLAAVAMIVGCAVQALAALVYLAPLVILQMATRLALSIPPSGRIWHSCL